MLGHPGEIKELPVFLENAVDLISNGGEFATRDGYVYFKPWAEAEAEAEAEGVAPTDTKGEIEIETAL